MLALAGAVSASRVYLIVPAGAIASSRFRARAGPLFRRRPTELALFDDAEILDEYGEPVLCAVDVIEAGGATVADAPSKSDYLTCACTHEVAEFARLETTQRICLDVCGSGWKAPLKRSTIARCAAASSSM